ncbi:hypothetical protein J2792_002330 [Novosphingobium capsulatum]|jgi:hypothetical protein|uniref:Lipoprotein n=1 Tax=Novosphingobium capsulatum TaxID=13688 RepID=A0ABU1MM86_9SPHN|nr:hypothetical protein [Novosphingobium capsulatum]MDR6511458.1 hypothetical protein [Novosphingobium capsulatum]
MHVRGLMGLLVAMLCAGCDSKPEPPKVEAEMVVSPQADSFNVACVSQPVLVEYTKHVGRGEKTLASAMIDEAQCAIIPRDGKFKILAVKADLDNLLREVEFVPDGSKSTDGMWTLDEAFAPQSPSTTAL